MAHLIYLPPELHCAIASLLRPRDIVNLRASCKKLRVLLIEHENYIVHAVITYRYSFLVVKMPLPQERSSIDPEVHEVMKTSTSVYLSRSLRLGRPYPASKLEYPQHFCQCKSCVYAWQLIWEKTYEALWFDWLCGLEEDCRGYVLQHLLFVYFYLNADYPSERLADFVVTRMQAFVVEITKSKLAYAFLLDYLLESLARYIEQEGVRILEEDPAFSRALCQPTEYRIPNLETDPESDYWIREQVDQDNSDRVARDVFRKYPEFLNWPLLELSFLSNTLQAIKPLCPGLGHNILQYLAEMKVMIDHDEDTIAHEASVQVRFGAEAARHDAVVVWAPRRGERHLQIIQLRKEKLSGSIVLSVSCGKFHAWFPRIYASID